MASSRDTPGDRHCRNRANIGGIERLNDLQNATPSVSGAEHYARIVMDTVLLRRLIHTAGEITDLAFSEPDDVTKAVDLAESKMFEVAEDRVVDSTARSASSSTSQWINSRRTTSAATRSPAPPPATTTSTNSCPASSPAPSTSSARGQLWASALPGSRRWSISRPAMW